MRDKSLFGAGTAGMALATALLTVLRAKGLISTDEARLAIDSAVLILEESGPLDAETAAARAQLEGLLATVEKLSPSRSD